MRLFKADCYVSFELENGETLKLDRKDSVYGRRLVVEFRCEKTRNPMPNSSMVTIYNLNQTTRDLISKNKTKCRFFVGYDEAFKLFAVGDVGFIDSRKNGQGDVVTEVRFTDGGKAYQEAKTRISLESGASTKQIIQGFANDMELVLKELPKEIVAAIDEPLTFDGLTQGALNQVAEDNNLEWSIQDEELVITTRDTPVDQDAILINSQTGLFNGVQKTQKGVKFTCQLHPELRPGKLVKLEATGYTIESGDIAKFVEPEKVYNGFYLVRSVYAIGDNNGGRFDGEVEASEYSV